MALDKLNPRSCSVICYKSHQTVHPNIPISATVESIPIGLPPKPLAAMLTGTSKPHADSGGLSFGIRSSFSLESSADLRNLYTRYPLLQNQLKEIYEAATNPSNDQLNNQLFSGERSDQGRGRGEFGVLPRDGVATVAWSRHHGVQTGIHRLRMLRRSKGEDGDGLREFSKLVTDPLKARK